MSDLLWLLALAGLFGWLWGKRDRASRPPPRTAAAGPRSSRPVWDPAVVVPPPPVPIRREPPPPPPVHEAPRLMTERTDTIIDGFTGARLDFSRPLWRCSHCGAFYEDASREALLAEVGGRCLSCDRAALDRFVAIPRPALRIAVAEPPAHRPGQVTLTLPVRWIAPAEEPGFFVAVLENKPWRQALKLIFPPAVSRRPEGARLIATLAGQRVTVAGRLITDGRLGPRIVVNDPAIVRITDQPLGRRPA